MAECLKCGRRIEKGGRGRPAVYCSTGCRRSVEYELRRIQRHLEHAEHEVTWLQPLEDNVSVASSFGGRRGEALANARAEIERLEARLRELLEAPD